MSEQQLDRAFFRHQPSGYFLTGGAVLAGWELAHRTPATMAWLLESLPVPAAPPGGVSREEVLEYKGALKERLLRLARDA